MIIPHISLKIKEPGTIFARFRDIAAFFRNGPFAWRESAQRTKHV